MKENTRTDIGSKKSPSEKPKWRTQLKEISETLNSLKTIAAVIVFFVGGAIFALNYFVQRSLFESEMQKAYAAFERDKDIYNANIAEAYAELAKAITELQCQMTFNDASISLEQNRMRKEAVIKANMEVVAKGEHLMANNKADENDILRLNEAKGIIASLNSSYMESEKSFKDAKSKMESSECRWIPSDSDAAIQ